MREIKFRAWSKKDLGYIDALQTIVLWPRTDPNYIYEQYTGLKDVNGVDIYEGDILSYDERDIYTGNYHKRPLIVRFLDDSAMFDASGLLLWKVSLRSEVVGNIHQNPELLEG